MQTFLAGGTLNITSVPWRRSNVVSVRLGARPSTKCWKAPWSLHLQNSWSGAIYKFKCSRVNRRRDQHQILCIRFMLATCDHRTQTVPFHASHAFLSTSKNTSGNPRNGIREDPGLSMRETALLTRLRSLGKTNRSILDWYISLSHRLLIRHDGEGSIGRQTSSDMATLATPHGQRKEDPRRAEPPTISRSFANQRKRKRKKERSAFETIYKYEYSNG